MVDPYVQRLLEQAINSPVKLQLVLTFHDNSHMEGTALQIAERIFRDIWSTREALNEMAQDGVLEKHGFVSDPIYRYHPRLVWNESIKRLCLCYNDPTARDQIQQAVREMASYARYQQVGGQSAYAYELI